MTNDDRDEIIIRLDTTVAEIHRRLFENEVGELDTIKTDINKLKSFNNYVRGAGAVILLILSYLFTGHFKEAFLFFKKS